MNYLDAILGIILIVSAINGFSKGFVEELAGLVALVLGIWAAIHFSDLVGEFLTTTFNMTFRHLHIVAFIVTFIGVVILVHIIGSIVNKMVKAIRLGFLNRLAGLAFGAVKGALILSVLLVVFDKIDKDVHIVSAETKAESKLYTPIRNFAPGIFPFLDFWKEDK
ncbi:MAG TPA: CvpA family protein [Prolixibacteraceae bacterium]|nr:CvpA family protein [Prolixibacteraceae bacterium]